MKAEDAVYVSALHARGRAVVDRVRPDGRVIVRFHDGARASVRAKHVRLLHPPSPAVSSALRESNLATARRPESVARLARLAGVPQPKPSTPRDRAYLDWLRGQPCVACAFPHGCDPSHHGRHGIGIKASDHDAVSMCRRCHDHWHHHYRVFGRDDLDEESTTTWLRQRAQQQRAEYERRRP